MELVLGLAGSAVLLLGLSLASIGLYGMLRRPPIFEQLHAAGLVTGSGVILVLLASLASLSAEIITSALLVLAFILVTSSLSTHAIALAAWHRGAAPGTAGARDTAAPAARRLPSSVGMRVLLAHDGSSGADTATALVASLAWPEGTLVRLIGAFEGDLEPFDPTGAATRTGGGTPDDVATPLEAAARRLRRPGLAVDHVGRRGDPATVIAAEAEAFAADLLVIGSRGLGPVRTLMEGSVVASVLDALSCPVLVARSPRVDRVLLATDGSAPSDAATEVVERWPIFDGLPVQVLSVAAGEMADMAQAQQVADATAARLRAAAREAVPHVRRGEAAAAIVEVARAQETDLVVLGSRGQTGLRRAILGSVARDVLASAEGSVLVVSADG